MTRAEKTILECEFLEVGSRSCALRPQDWKHQTNSSEMAECKEDLVMIPCGGAAPDRSVVRLERLPHDAVRLGAAHHVAEGPFSGIIINKPAPELEEVGQPDLTLSFDVSMTNKQRKINPEFKERRLVHFWFKSQSGDPEQGREYMRELLTPEEFPRDYVGFIKKAVLLAHRFTTIRRIDLVLIPQSLPTAAELEMEERRRQEEEQRRREEEKRRAEAEERRRQQELRRHQEEQRRAEQERQERLLREKQKKEQEELQWRREQEAARREAERRRVDEEQHKWRRLREEEQRQRAAIEQGESKVQETSEESSDQPIQNYITVVTPAVYDYQYLPEVPVSNKTCVSFRVRARSDAHLALSAVYGDTDRKTYEIVIGADGNRRSMVRLGGEGPIMAEATTLGVLDGGDFRAFWLSWGNSQIKVGKGSEEDARPFLQWNIPSQKVHGVNCLAVSTAPGSDGQWEFVEYIYPHRQEDETVEARRARVRTSLMWLAKKQKMLQVLEDAYPNSVNTAELLRMCKIGLHDMMTSVVVLKEFEKRRLITEVVRGVWLRSPSGAPADQHVIRVVDDLPVLRGRDIPTVAIVTTLYCEKLAVDAMMDHKVSYVKYKPEGESQVYTMGRIGQHMCVSTKLSRVVGSSGSAIAAGNSVTRLLGMFEKVQHVLLVGTGGAVPDYSDYRRHVRLGDVVVSAPLTSSTSHQRSAVASDAYICCDTFSHDEKTNEYNFQTRGIKPSDSTLQTCVSKLKESSERGGVTPPWQRHIEQGLQALNAEESSFSRPSIRRDKLYAWIDGERVQVEHPAAPKIGPHVEGVTRIRYGAIASGKFVSRNEKLRYDFARRHEVLAFDSDDTATCLDAVLGSRKESFILIRGSADYLDGSRLKEWQPYAALAAAAFMKSLVCALPTTHT